MESTKKTHKLRNFHLPLPDGLYSELRAEAKRSKRPATELARQGIAFWLKQRKKVRLDEELARYVAAHAGTEADLDAAFEAAGIESWFSSDDLDS
ncbi:MAG: hypothetical protein HY721_31500 [Planctomycetes bacterium]|nr:hypothetical protein [Planctomycetota bacterium]